jgi:hypothetical protein
MINLWLQDKAADRRGRDAGSGSGLSPAAPVH